VSARSASSIPHKLASLQAFRLVDGKKIKAERIMLLARAGAACAYLKKRLTGLWERCRKKAKNKNPRVFSCRKDISRAQGPKASNESV
jgi:hypothetical protein